MPTTRYFRHGFWYVWVPKLQLVQDLVADALLDDNPFALLVGMLLDQPKRIAWLPTFTTKQRQTSSPT